MTATDPLEAAIEGAHDDLDADRPAEALARLTAFVVGGGGPPRLVGEALGLCAVASRALGAVATARQYAQGAIEALEPLAGVGDADASLALAGVLEDAAEVELIERAYEAAAAALRRAVSIRRALGDAVGCETWLAVAEAERACGGLEAALDAASNAFATATGDADVEGEALALELRGDLLAERGPTTVVAAAEAYGLAATRWQGLDRPDALARCIVGRARLAELTDDAVTVRALAASLDALRPVDDEARAAIAQAKDEIGDLLAGLAGDAPDDPPRAAP